jgi:subtilisin family serine protease
MKKIMSLVGMVSLFNLQNVFATTAIIPRLIPELHKSKSQKLVFKNAKGTILKKSDPTAAVTPENWFNLSPSDGAQGVSTELVYKNFGAPVSEDIIVAVIDSGVDVNHEDLQGKIWVNTGEIADDGIDNDHNGYIDDVFGWNFIGAKDGKAQIVKDGSLNGYKLISVNPTRQVNGDNLEVTRELARLEKLQEALEAQGSELSARDAAQLAKVKAAVEAELKNNLELTKKYEERKKIFITSAAVLESAGVKEINLNSVTIFVAMTEEQKMAKEALMDLLGKGIDLARIEYVFSYLAEVREFHYNKSLNTREIVGDDYDDLFEKNYGNNDVIGGDASHGTHVSGIIAAERLNALGMKGVATNVKIMAIRCVPNGDERDKDVANSIRYAVDNGAKIINMSFGKAYSPYKAAVDAAVKYAEKKGVLLVHAAGNSNQNNDVAPNFPNKKLAKEMRVAENWLEIGASSFEKGLNLPADFSNYGKNSVDLFAPGVDIYSTTPGNQYDTFSGTSMASPTTAGVAALILSYDSSLDAAQLKSLMMDTSRRYPRLTVLKPAEVPSEKVLFSNLSIAGSVVDALTAVSSLK